METAPEDKLISVRDAAKECGRNPETVRRWIWSGKLPAEKLGNQLFVKKSELLKYYAETLKEEESSPDSVTKAAEDTTVETSRADESTGTNREEVFARLKSLRAAIRNRTGNINIDEMTEQHRGGF
jgi:excisionase family DNA binding protein